MTSNIDPTHPVTGQASTANVRANFQAAYDEISTLQDQVAALFAANPDDVQAQIAALQADVAALKARTVAAVRFNTPSPPNTQSPNFVLAVDGIPFSPTQSTRGFITVDGQIGNLSNVSISDVQLVYGQGAPPAAGTLVSVTNGTLIDEPATMQSARSGDYGPFSRSTMLSALDTSQTYWLSVAYRAESGTCTLSALSLEAFELLDPLP